MADTSKSAQIPNQKLRREREQRYWSQKELAEELGTTTLTVSRWERGIIMPSLYFRKRLCEVFGKNEEQLGLTPSQSASHTAGTSDAKASSSTPVSVWNVPYRRNPYFTGREDVLEQIHSAFHTGDGTRTCILALTGLGGIGKTQIALEYAYRYRDQYSATLWARATSYDVTRSNILAIAHLLNVADPEDEKSPHTFRAVLHWFETHDHWLLILDNVSDLKAIRALIPSSGHGLVVLTTRTQITGALAQHIDVEPMTEDEGIQLVLRRARLLKSTWKTKLPADVRNDALTIVQAFGRLPLALDQAGAYIEEKQCALAEYYKLAITHRKRLLRIRGQDALGHPEPVATTWTYSVEEVSRANPAATELLYVCAFLHPEAIPEAMLIRGIFAPSSMPHEAEVDIWSFNTLVGELLKRSLVRRSAEAKTLTIHPLVQAIIRDNMTEEEQRIWAERAILIVHRALAASQGQLDRPLYLPQLQTCIALIKRWHCTFPEALEMLAEVENGIHDEKRSG